MKKYDDFELDLRKATQGDLETDSSIFPTTGTYTYRCRTVQSCPPRCKVPTLGKTKIPAASCHKKGCGLAQLRC